MTDTGADPDGTAADSPGSVEPAELKRRLDAGERVRLLDTRNRDEIDEWRIEHPNAELVHVPYMNFVSANATGDVASLVPDDGPFVAVCGRGEASAEVARWLSAAGVEAANLAGGMEGWAGVYEAVELAADAGGATVLQYGRPSSGCLSYLIVAGGEALVVDPLRAFADRYPADARERGAVVTAAVDTHVHADHVSGLRAVADATGATPIMSVDAVARGVTFDVETVAGGDAIDVGEVAVEVIASPGHTTGAVSLRAGDLLLCGDTLFTDGLARPDLQGGEADGDGADDGDGTDDAEALARELYRTLTGRFADLPDGTVIAPGHYQSPPPPGADGSYTAPLGTLRERFDVFSESESAFVERVLATIPPRPNEFERIVAINLGRETVEDGEAFELELGPNNCAAAAD